MRIVADVDTGIDDALALTWLASRADVDLVAVTTTAGNSTAQQSAHNSKSVLAASGQPNIPVCAGRPGPLSVELLTTPETHGDDGLGYATLPDVDPPAPGEYLDVWREAVTAPTTLLVTGPCTNLGHALRAEADLVRAFERIVILGGSFDYPGNTTPTAEWNMWSDPHAAADVFNAFTGLPVEQLPILLSLQESEKCEFTPSFLDALCVDAGLTPPQLSPASERGRRRSTGHELADLLAGALQFYFEFHADYGYGYLAHTHDLAAAMIAVGAVDVDVDPQWVGVETSLGLTRGTTVRDARHLLGHPPNARLVRGLDPQAVFETFRRDVTTRWRTPR